MAFFSDKQFFIVVVLVVAIGAYIRHRANEAAKDYTKPAGEALARITQWLNGSHDVEINNEDFILHREYFRPESYQLTTEAADVLPRFYGPERFAVYFTADNLLKPEYHELIGGGNV